MSEAYRLIRRKKDKYGVKIGAWAVKHSPGIATYGYYFTTINFTKGKDPLVSHSEFNKHRAKPPNIKCPNSQLTIEKTMEDGIENMSKQCEERKKVKSLELDIVRSLSRHGILFEYVNCLN